MKNENRVRGGLRSKEKMLAKNKDYYVELGKIGGRSRKTITGFNSETGKMSGSLGGTISKKGYKYLYEEIGRRFYMNKATGEIESFEL